MLPHLTALQGAIVLRASAGRVPMYSGLVPDFIERLGKLADDEVSILPFETIDAFHAQMQALIHHSTPALPARLHDGMPKKTQARKR